MDNNFRDYFLTMIQNIFHTKIFKLRDNGLACDLVLISSWIFGNRLVSTGYLTDGGIVGDDTQSLDRLVDNMMMIATDHNVDYIELRGGIKPNIVNLISREMIYANFTKDVINTTDILASIPRKKRADIRKALNNPELEFTKNVCVDEFYSLFSQSQHQHGTPIHYKKYYQELSRDADFVKIYGITHKGNIVATCMVFFGKNELIAYYGAANKDYIGHHVYDLLYYHLMQVAQEKKIIFNFGRSKYHTGSFDYKTFWGIEPIPTTHYIIPISSKPIPDLRANNPEFSQKIALWRKMPRWFVNILGGFVLKNIG